ncbi:MAG: hypothetical protein IVW57_17710, partial [Ktedonobacterales bacterium]|nr:hypothetical protein [Ktedonobacterales bacterium]
MKLAYAILADAAQLGQDGKVSLLGGDFDTINAATFPLTHPALSLVMRLDFEPREAEREYWLRVTLAGPGNAPLAATPASAFTPRVLPGREEQVVRAMFVIGLNGLTFDQQGTYQFRLLVDDT